MSSLCLSKEEIIALTKKHHPSKQLEILLSRGFYRAYRVDGMGDVILERAHYEAVCMGGIATNKPRPKVRPIRNEERSPA